MSTKLFLVDDHPMVSNGFKQFVSSRADLELLGEAASGREALRLLAGCEPDLLIMDVHLPDLSGLVVADQLLQKRPNLKILMFSGDDDRILVDQALKTGVRGYLLKNATMEELVKAFETVLSGRLYFSNEVCADILEDYRRALTEPEEPVRPSCSERDARLLRLIAEGRRSKEIAADLGLSVKSIETYRSRLMKRLGCNSTAELVRYAIREGLVEP